MRLDNGKIMLRGTNYVLRATNYKLRARALVFRRTVKLRIIDLITELIRNLIIFYCALVLAIFYMNIFFAGYYFICLTTQVEYSYRFKNLDCLRSQLNVFRTSKHPKVVKVPKAVKYNYFSSKNVN